MPDPDFAGAAAYALARLQAELAPLYTYHNLAHTRDEVIPAVARLAAREGVRRADRRLLHTAACFHDLGFIQSPHDHEATSARLAAALLPGFGFTPPQVAAIAGMILATRLPQQPQTLLEAILADADLDVLGRADFPARNAALRAEVAALGAPPSDAAWYCGQWRFLAGHHYFTASARALRDTQKLVHLRALAARCTAAG